VECLDYGWETDNVNEWHGLWFVGDQHYGATDCAVERMVQNVEEIQETPRSRVVLMGDCCDFVNYTDKRFDIQQVAVNLVPRLDDLPRRAADEFIKIYEPIKDKIVCLIPGNHDETIRRKYHFDVCGYIAGVMGIPLMTTITQLRLRVRTGSSRNDRSFEVKGVVSHAEKGSQTVGGKVTAASKIFDFFGPHDFIAQAHMHEYLVHEGVGLDVGGAFGRPKTRETQRMLFLTGGYLKTYGRGTAGYGEKRGYRPCKLGSPRLEMRLHRTSEASGHKGGRSVDVKELRGF
jgi:hypothetical protein